MAIRPARQLLKIAAAEVAAAEVAAAEVAAAEVAAAVVPAAGGEAEAAPVRRGEAGVDVVDPAAVRLHLAHVGLDTLLDLVRAGGAGRDGAARPAFRGRPVDVAHRHAVPRVEEARRTPVGLGLAGREGFGAGQVVLSLGDGPADHPHVPGPP